MCVSHARRAHVKIEAMGAVCVCACCGVCLVQVKLIGQLFSAHPKKLNEKELQQGLGRFLEDLEDIAIDVPSAPKVLCEFLVHGTKDKYLTWDWIQSMAEKHVVDKERFVGTLLSTLLAELGAKDAAPAWRGAGENGVSIKGFGVEDESALIEKYALDQLFPLSVVGRLIPGLLAGDMPDDEIIAEIEKSAGELELTVDREISRMLVGHILQKAVAELGGAETLLKYEGEDLIVPQEKAALKKREKLLKKWLEKECDQAFALFEVQKCAQDLGYPKGPPRSCSPPPPPTVFLPLLSHSLLLARSLACSLACVRMGIHACMLTRIMHAHVPYLRTKILVVWYALHAYMHTCVRTYIHA